MDGLEHSWNTHKNVLVLVCVFTTTCPSGGLYSHANHKVHAPELYNDLFFRALSVEQLLRAA